jgi:hypothetical protein
MGNCCSLFFAVQDGALAAGENLRGLAIPRHRVVSQPGTWVRDVVDEVVMSEDTEVRPSDVERPTQ